jgi:hypothetical protein
MDLGEFFLEIFCYSFSVNINRDIIIGSFSVQKIKEGIQTKPQDELTTPYE